jgi:hypothetical protein
MDKSDPNFSYFFVHLILRSPLLPLTYKERNDGGADIDESSGLGGLVGGQPEFRLDGWQGQGRPGHHSAQTQRSQACCTMHTMDE